MIELLDSDPQTRYFGECALVGSDSPVLRKALADGLVFHDPLWDEQCAGHIAPGASYSCCVKDGDSMSPEHLLELGANQCPKAHFDIMVTSPETETFATLEDGSVHQILAGVEWGPLGLV